MAKLFHSFLRQTLFRKKDNLLSLDDPYPTMLKLFGDKPVLNILDAGASNGHVTRRLLKQFPNATSYLFEPNPAYAPQLQTLAKQDSRIVPQLKALSNTEGQMTFHITQSPGRSSLFKTAVNAADADHEKRQVKQTIDVPVVTVDQWKQRENVGKIDLMKLDIQAGELNALKGADKTLREEVSMIFTEAFFNPRYQGGALFGEIDTYLRQCGFTLFSIYSPRANEQGKLLWANVLFVHEERLNMTH